MLDTVVDLADEDTEFRLHIFLIPDPGSFVNLIDALDIKDIREKENISPHQSGDRAF